MIDKMNAEVFMAAIVVGVLCSVATSFVIILITRFRERRRK